MVNRKITYSSLVILSLLVPLALAQSVLAVDFYLPPISSSMYGVGNEGVIHIKIDTNSDGNPDTWIETYCIAADDYITGGNEYGSEMNEASDTAANRAIAYILSWWHMPGTYTGTANPGYVPSAGFDPADAQSIQRAIWKITDGNTVSGQAQVIANDANGKDIVDQTDTLTLTKISQTETTATIKATLTTSGGTGHSNVLIVFSLTGCTTTDLTTENQWNLPSGYTLGDVTDSNGEIQFTITFTQDAPLIKVDAYTKGVWPNTINPEEPWYMIWDDYQDLTTTHDSSLVVKTEFLVVPEYLLGGLLALGACFAAFAVYKNRATLIEPKL